MTTTVGFACAVVDALLAAERTALIRLFPRRRGLLSDQRSSAPFIRRERTRGSARSRAAATGGTVSLRLVEPHRLVSWGRRWYLVGWDVDRDDWRTFRADRIALRVPAGPRCAPRDPPDGDVLGWIARRMGTMWPYQVRVRVHAPAEAIADAVNGAVEPVDEHTCVLTLGGDSIASIVVILGLLDADFDVVEPPEPTAYLARLGDRYHRAARPAD